MSGSIRIYHRGEGEPKQSHLTLTNHSLEVVPRVHVSDGRDHIHVRVDSQTHRISGKNLKITDTGGIILTNPGDRVNITTVDPETDDFKLITVRRIKPVLNP